VQLASPVLQAALSGYSDRAMRVLARRYGAAYCLGEVLLDAFVITADRSKRNNARLALSAEEHPVGAQLMGSNPDDFPPAARRLVAEGYDVIDINFGCPVKKVLGRCRGGYLLSVPETALEIVARVRDAVPANIPVTLKMRRGIDDSAQSAERFWTIFDGAFERGVAAITVHGRTREQGFGGTVNLAGIRAGVQALKTVPVIGNGDVASLIFFGTFAISAFLGMPSIDRKLAARSPEAAVKLRAETSILPFGAILAGRNRLVLGEVGWLPLLLALLGWAVVLHFHARFFGVPALLPF
jgi:tRNA-dihydrouridine synthase B